MTTSCGFADLQQAMCQLVLCLWLFFALNYAVMTGLLLDCLHDSSYYPLDRL